MSCGLLKVGCIRGMFVLMLFPGRPVFIVSKKCSCGWTFCVLSDGVTLLLPRLGLAASGDFSALSAQVLPEFSDAVPGDGVVQVALPLPRAGDRAPCRYMQALGSWNSRWTQPLLLLACHILWSVENVFQFLYSCRS